jgi:hypothetical protein
MKAFFLLPFVLIMCFSKVFGQVRKDSLYVFVGKKIEVRAVPEKREKELVDTTIDGTDTIYSTHRVINMDAKFIAKYKILQLMYGSFKSDTIEFVAYDHFGIPAFSKHENVLLFIFNRNGHLYHERYQYFPVYKTKDDRWAGAYQPSLYEEDSTTAIRPERIDFKKQVSFNIKGREQSDIKESFPEPYFKIVSNKAIAIWGNYVEELFELEKQAVLKDRGFF